MFYYMIVWTRHFLINKLLITFYTKRNSKLFFLDFLITIIIHTINYLVSVSCWLVNLFMPMQWTQFNDSSCNNYSSFLLCRIKIMHFLLCKTAHYLLFYIFLLYYCIKESNLWSNVTVSHRDSKPLHIHIIPCHGQCGLGWVKI